MATAQQRRRKMEKIIWTIESSDPHDFCFANCIAVTTCIADDKFEFDSFEEAVACIPQLQAENPDLDYAVQPRNKLNHGTGSCEDTRRRCFAGRITKEADANGCTVTDYVRKTIGDYREKASLA
jgi:hypothetical protein